MYECWEIAHKSKYGRCNNTLDYESSLSCTLGKAGLGRTSVEHIDFTRLLSEANVFGASIKTADDMTEDKNHRVALKEWSRIVIWW